MIVQLRMGISNVFLLKGNQTILVDVGSHTSADSLLQAIQRENVDINNISLVLHTHGHSDHCAGAWESKRTIVAPIAIHRDDSQMLKSGTNNPLVPIRLAGALIRPLVDRRFRGAEPDILIDQEMDLQSYGVDARVILTPGHTSGSISVITGEGEAIVGDIMMGGHLGGIIFPHRPRYHYFADDLNTVRASIKKVMDHSPKKIYVGHGGPLEPDAVIKYFSKDIVF